MNPDYIIIKKGSISAPPEWTRELTCDHCNCVFKGRIKDTWFNLTTYGNIELIGCPTCKKSVTVRENHGVD